MAIFTFKQLTADTAHLGQDRLSIQLVLGFIGRYGLDLVRRPRVGVGHF